MASSGHDSFQLEISDRWTLFYRDRLLQMLLGANTTDVSHVERKITSIHDAISTPLFSLATTLLSFFYDLLPCFMKGISTHPARCSFAFLYEMYDYGVVM